MASDRATSPRVSMLALASLVCGIVWVVGIGSVCAVLLGHLALHRMRRTGQPGRALAVVGLVLGYVGIVGAIVYLVGGNVSVRDGGS